MITCAQAPKNGSSFSSAPSSFSLIGMSSPVRNGFPAISSACKVEGGAGDEHVPRFDARSFAGEREIGPQAVGSAASESVADFVAIAGNQFRMDVVEVRKVGGDDQRMNRTFVNIFEVAQAGNFQAKADFGSSLEFLHGRAQLKISAFADLKVFCFRCIAHGVVSRTN